MPEVPSMALGSLEVRPIDMAAAYATFANDGVYAKPYLVDEVRDRDGKVLVRHEPETHRAISEQTARTVNQILSGVITKGTGTRARFADGRPAAGKTGTTSNYADAWFVGYTPLLWTAVWMGSPIGTEDKMTNVGGIRVTGGSYPARIWQAFMGPAMEGLDPIAFPAPEEEAEKGEYLHIEGEPDKPRPRPKPTTTVPAEPTDGGTDPGDTSNDGGSTGGNDAGGNDHGKPPKPDDQTTTDTGQTAESG
jgi:membrane peptidoglycan carboxypeptidase